MPSLELLVLFGVSLTARQTPELERELVALGLIVLQEAAEPTLWSAAQTKSQSELSRAYSFWLLPLNLRARDRRVIMASFELPCDTC